MKTVWICGLVVGACLGVSGWAVKPGDSRQAVIEELGVPTGFIGRGDAETLYYERGIVQLKTGTVVNTELISAEQLREKREAERARVLTSQAQAPQQVQQVVYAQQQPQPQIVYVQQPPQQQVVYVVQPAPQQVVYLAQQQQPQVVYYSQPTPIMYSPQTVYSYPYYSGCYPCGYGAGGPVSYYRPTFYGGRVGYGGGGGYSSRGGGYGGGRASGRGSYRR